MEAGLLKIIVCLNGSCVDERNLRINRSWTDDILADESNELHTHLSNQK
jgi:hypothetical protein